MKKVVFNLLLILPVSAFTQSFSGYYLSEPKVTDFDHFKIKHHNEHTGQFDGVFTLKAFIDNDEMWQEEALIINGSEAIDLVQKYGEGRDILSVHKMKIGWDGDEWEFIMLGYHDEQKHGRFIVVEEVFSDDTKYDLVEINKFKLVKAHHIKDDLAVNRKQ